MKSLSTLTLFALLAGSVQPIEAQHLSEHLQSRAGEVHVKSLAGPPSELELNHLPTAEEILIPTNILVLDRVANGPNGPTKAAPTGFSATEGVGFSLVQVTTNYPYFSPSTFYGPNGTRYSFSGSSLTCDYGPCADDQADLHMEAFTNQAGGGVAIVSISGTQVTTSSSWQLSMDPPLLALAEHPAQGTGAPNKATTAAPKSVAVDSTLSFDDYVAETSPILKSGAFLSGEPQTLAVSFRSSLAKSLGPSAMSLTGLDVNVVDTQSLGVVHRKSLNAKSAGLMARDEAGRILVELPALGAGEYTIRLDIEADIQGVGSIERTAFLHMPVIEPAHRLNGQVTTEVVDADRLRVRLGVDSLTEQLQHYYAYAEVWSSALDVPIAWIGGMTYPEQDSAGAWSLPMMLDGRWIAKADLQGRAFDLELRNVRVQDPDTFIPVTQASRLAVEPGALPKSAWPKSAWQKASQVVEDASLFEGKGDVTIPMEIEALPAEVLAETATKSHDTGLFLVHGWCSPPAWVSSAFPGNTTTLIGGTAEFVDSVQSRSHDNFAQRIRDQGDARFSDGFSVVAHSQGGAAATHLRAFYNSGLDDITAPRRIQSVGTPYRGSTLMDLYLATGPLGWLIAEIFDFCSPQWNLGTVGSALWLSSIPNSVRSEVHYYRTRHRRPSNIWQRAQFWRWKCGAGSYVIGGDDDGVVSVNQGVLSGGQNRGITDSECHVGGMRYPDQKDNASRNAVMNQEGRPDPPPCTVAGSPYVYMSGPSSRSPGQSGTWYASVSGGVGPYTYSWFKSTQSGIFDLWGQTSVSTSHSDSFNVVVDVRDSCGRFGTTYMQVSVGSGGGGDGDGGEILLPY